MPGISPIDRRLRALHQRYRDLDLGEVANYIPELARVDPDRFGIALVTVDGHVYRIGDSDRPFTIQSVSKPFVFSRVLDDHGAEDVLDRVGVEPTGDPFNSIVLDENANRPPNPMVNSGAIAVTGLVLGDDPEHRWARIHGILESFAGRPLDVDEAVASSEAETGHRNRAIAHLMRNFDMVRPEVDEVLDLYFRQCAVNVDAVDLAMMGATLAAGGHNPRSGEQVVDPSTIPSVLSVMSSCGMYDSSGTWLYQVGLPAKSGVGGGIVAVLPGQLGIGVYSPRLDANGNSVRGLRVCADLSRDLGLHLFTDGPRASDTIRSVQGRDTVTSRRVRPQAEEAILRHHGREVVIVELQGRLVFGSVEIVSRRLEELSPRVRYLVLDLRRVQGGDPAAAVLLAELLEASSVAGIDVTVAGQVPAGPLHAALLAEGVPWRLAADVDRALEEVEEAILEFAAAPSTPSVVELGEFEVCRGLDAEDLAVLETCAPVSELASGTEICRPGVPGGSAFFVLSGRIVVSAADEQEGAPRLRVLGPGSLVGEMALLSGGMRSAWLFAEGDLVVRELSEAGLEAFVERRPEAAVQLLRNIACLLGTWLRDANRDPGDALVVG